MIRFPIRLQRFMTLVTFFGAIAMLPGMAQAVLITVTFNEPGAPSGQLDGTTFYESMGIADFENSQRIGPDPRLPDDGFGIVTTGPVGAVIFSQAVSNVALTWATSAGEQSFFADIFDADDNVLDSFFFDGSGSSSAQNGTADLLGNGIARLEFHDGVGFVAIDTLSYSVPEPATLALLGLGLAGMGYRRRQKVETA